MEKQKTKLNKIAAKKFLCRYELKLGANVVGILMCEKASVILSWVVISAVWLAQTICLLLVLIIQYSSEAALVAWVISLCFAILCVGILLYCLLVGYGYWLELKSKGNQEE